MSAGRAAQGSPALSAVHHSSNCRGKVTSGNDDGTLDVGRSCGSSRRRGRQTAAADQAPAQVDQCRCVRCEAEHVVVRDQSGRECGGREHDAGGLHAREALVQGMREDEDQVQQGDVALRELRATR